MKNSLVLLFIISFSLFSINSGNSQNSEDHEILLRFPHYYKKNNQKYPILFSQKKLKKELFKSSRSLHEFEKFEKQRNLFWLSFMLGSTSLITYHFIEQENTNFKNGLIVGSFISASFSLHFGIKSYKKLDQAIWIRNQDILK